MKIVEISPSKLKEMLLAQADFFLIDVRDPEEHEEGHIEKSILIPLHTLAERIKGIKKDKVLITYCRTGVRSKNAAELLEEMGYIKVSHLEGGYEAWLQESD